MSLDHEAIYKAYAGTVASIDDKGDSSKLTAYYAACEKVKTDNPKPS